MLKRLWAWMHGYDYIEVDSGPIETRATLEFLEGPSAAVERVIREAKKHQLRYAKPGQPILWDDWVSDLYDEVLREDAEYRRRMRGGYDIPGIP